MLPANVHVGIEPTQADGDTTIVLKIIIASSDAGFVGGAGEAALPLYSGIDFDAPADVPVEVDQRRRRRPRWLLFGASAAALIGLAVLATHTTQPSPAAVAPTTTIETRSEQPPPSPPTFEGVLSSLNPGARRYAEAILSLTPEQLIASYRTGLPARRAATNGPSPTTQEVLAALGPGERQYVEGIVALAPERVAAGFGNLQPPSLNAGRASAQMVRPPDRSCGPSPSGPMRLAGDTGATEH